MYFEKKLYNLLNEEDSDKYTHIGYGKYKKKGEEDKEDAEVFKKDDAGNFISAKGDDAEKQDAPKKVAKIDTNPFDDEPEDKPASDSNQAKKDQYKADALAGAAEGVQDAINRGLDLGDPDVADMVISDLRDAIRYGASEEDIKNLAKEMGGEGGEMISQAYEDIEQFELDDRPVGDRRDDYVDDELEDEEPEYMTDTKDVDPDEGFDTALKNIRPEAREKAFEVLMQSFDDDYDLSEIYKNLKQGKMPNPAVDSFGAMQHIIIMQGIEEGTLKYGTTGMELANYLETREEDIYDQMMNPDQYDNTDSNDDSDDSDDKYAGLESYEVSMAKDADEAIAKHGKNLPPGTDFRTKIDDLDEDEVDAFYDDVANEYAQEYDITMGVFDDNKNYFMDEEGMTMSDLVTGIISSAEEAAEEGGYLSYGESVKPKNQPLRENYNRLFKGRDVL